MEHRTESLVKEFREYAQKIKYIHEALGVLYWDLRTGAPKKGMEQRSEVIGALSGEAFALLTSERMGNYLQELSADDTYAGLDPVTRGIVREMKKEYDKWVKIPAGRYREYVVLTSKAETVWEEAKAKSDFALFQPYLEKIVAFQQEFADCWGYEGNRYNALLDQYEPGITVAQLDRLFQSLRENIVPLVREVESAPARPDLSFLRQHFEPEKQKQFCRFILEQMGVDFDAARLDLSVHPFCIGLNPGDVRITNRYNPRDVREGIFGAIHEGGHALYEQNIAKELAGTPLCDGASMGIHESQSRFWENMVARSLPFWERYYGDLVRLFPDQLGRVSVSDFHFAVNEAKASLIRTEADELTYNLHILIRYELEKGLIDGEIRVADLPQLWKEKMQAYLGIVPSNDAEGVLQDVHWAGGSFGYFPSYTLGNLYAAQFHHALCRDIPDCEERIRRGELLPIQAWLTEKIHRHGKLLSPAEILVQATGEPLNAQYLTGYLERKYRALYQLN